MSSWLRSSKTIDDRSYSWTTTCREPRYRMLLLTTVGGRRQAVEKLVEEGRRRILFLGGNSAVAALQDRHAGYCDALKDAGLKRDKSLTVWRDAGDGSALKTVRSLLQGSEASRRDLCDKLLPAFPVSEVTE